jgi:RNA polymerase sigma-70 factor (ECF subfamily)
MSCRDQSPLASHRLIVLTEGDLKPEEPISHLTHMGSSAETEGLVQALRRGEEDAYRHLIERYKGMVYGIALRIIGDHTEADDIAQETFVRVYEKVDRFRGGSKLSTWIYRIALNLSLERQRRIHRRGETSWDGLAASESALVDPAPTPEQAAAHASEAEAVRAAIEQLPERYRVPLMLCYMENLSLAQAADVVGITEGGMKTRLHRARKILLGKLRDI